MKNDFLDRDPLPFPAGKDHCHRRGDRHVDMDMERSPRSPATRSLVVSSNTVVLDNNQFKRSEPMPLTKRLPRMSAFRRYVVALLLVALTSLGLANQLDETSPAALPPKPDYPLAGGFDRAEDTEGRTAWRPEAHTAPASLVERDGRRVWKMPCNFEGTTMWRVAWDRSVQLDMRAAMGLRFRVYCPDPSPIGGLTVYLRSGKGWYSGHASLERSGEWQTVTVSKATVGREGAPGDWGHIDTIRIAVERAKDANTVFYVTDFGLVGHDAPITIVRGDSLSRTDWGAFGSMNKCMAALARHLDVLQAPYTVVSDDDLTSSLLRHSKLVILPYNRKLPEGAAKALADYLESGGKLICFQTIPLELRSLVGIDVGKPFRSVQGRDVAGMRAVEGVLRGLPASIPQRRLWNACRSLPLAGRSRAAAHWYDTEGSVTETPAIVVSENAILMPHLLLNEDGPETQTSVLAIAGHLMPELWKSAAEEGVAGIGRFGPHRDTAAAVTALRKGAAPAVAKLVEEAAALRAKAERLLQADQFPESLEAATEARDLLIRAFCTRVPSQPDERRLIWSHHAWIPGMSWGEAAENLAGNGFTAVVPNMLWGGAAFYPSKVLPVVRPGDAIRDCLEASKEHGLEVHVWKCNWNMELHTPKDFVERMRKEGRTQVSFDGKKRDWLCPSHPANRQLEIESMVEIARNYEVDGLHFDFIRYPSDAFCFCEGCRERFEKRIGSEVFNWPEDVRPGGALRDGWLQFRRDNITAVVAAVSAQARKVRPGIELSAAVYVDLPTARDANAQDWGLWCREGYLDFVCPMDYTPDLHSFEARVQQQMEWAGPVPCYPGIGVVLWGESDPIFRLIDQVQITRRLGTGGFTFYNYGPGVAADIVPRCGLGLTRKPAREDP